MVNFPWRKPDSSPQEPARNWPGPISPDHVLLEQWLVQRHIDRVLSDPDPTEVKGGFRAALEVAREDLEIMSDEERQAELAAAKAHLQQQLGAEALGATQATVEES